MNVRNLRLLPIVCAVGTFVVSALGQGTLDSFDPNPNGTVRAVVLQPDGKIIIGGDFTTVGGTNRPHLARLNVDGTVDATFYAAAITNVFSLALQPDGKILVGREFSIMRLNTTGTVDTNFNSSVNNTVKKIVVQSDGRILLNGYFNTLAGQSRPGLGRLNANGSLDTGFVPAYGCLTFESQADGKVLISNAGFDPYSHLRRLNTNGTLDVAFRPSVTLPDIIIEYTYIPSIVVQPDDKILIGGWFYSVNGQPRNSFARLHLDGSLDTNFYPVQGFQNTMALQPQGSIVTHAGGGAFERCNAMGHRDSNFTAQATGLTANNDIEALLSQPDGKILVGGGFTAVNGTNRNYLARLNAADHVATNGPRPTLVGFKKMNGGVFRFNATNLGETNLGGMSVVASSDPALALAYWSLVGPVSFGGSYFQFTDPVAATNGPRRFYQLRYQP